MYKKTPSNFTIRNRRRFIARAILWSGFIWCAFSVARLFWIGEAQVFDDGGMVFPDFSTDLKSFVSLWVIAILLFLLVLSFFRRLKIRIVTVEHSRTKFYEGWSKYKTPYHFVNPSHTIDVREAGKRWLRTYRCSTELCSRMKVGNMYVVCINGTLIEAARLANSADEWKLEQGLDLEMN